VECSRECGNEHWSSINAAKLLSGYTTGDLSNSTQLGRIN
jgi:hypothetical protein